LGGQLNEFEEIGKEQKTLWFGW